MDSYESTEAFLLTIEREAKRYFAFIWHYYSFEEKIPGSPYYFQLLLQLNIDLNKQHVLLDFPFNPICNMS